MSARVVSLSTSKRVRRNLLRDVIISGITSLPPSHPPSFPSSLPPSFPTFFPPSLPPSLLPFLPTSLPSALSASLRLPFRMFLSTGWLSFSLAPASFYSDVELRIQAKWNAAKAYETQVQGPGGKEAGTLPPSLPPSLP